MIFIADELLNIVNAKVERLGTYNNNNIIMSKSFKKIFSVAKSIGRELWRKNKHLVVKKAF